jgi:hypothetical protein
LTPVQAARAYKKTMREHEKPKVVKDEGYVPAGFRGENDPNNQSKAKKPLAPNDFDVKNSDYTKSLLVSDINEDKYRIQSRSLVETKATN